MRARPRGVGQAATLTQGYPGTLASRIASRGTETSAVVLVGPPWRMESNAGLQQWY